MMAALAHGSVIWVDFDPVRGQEQRGIRPALVVSSGDYLASVNGLVIVVPVTTTNRGWPHHVAIRGDLADLPRRSFAMTEQPRTLSQERIDRLSGQADHATMADVHQWLSDFIRY